MIKQIFNFQFSIFNTAEQKGFTLVEMLVAVGIFVVIATFALGAILSIFDANRKAQSSKTVVDNLSLGLENIARTVRFGGSYYCGVSSNLTATRNCSSGGTSLSVTFEGRRVIYRLNNEAIQRSDDGGASYANITAPEAVIEYARFYVVGAGTAGGDTDQPYVIVVIKGYVGGKPSTQSSFSIQTLMSQRELDI